MKRSITLMTLAGVVATFVISAIELPLQLNAPVQSLKLDANNISTWFRNNGSFNREPVTDNAGFEWPKGSGHKDRYASGLWIAAKVDSDTLICLAEYDYEYLPGYVDDNGLPQGYNDPAYEIYSIIRGDTLSPDYQNWPAYQGAYLDSKGKPFFLGTQTMFYSYTDGYPEAHGNNAGSTAPLKAQILQTNWSYTNIGMRDVCFTEYRIVNRSQRLWRDCYIAVWTDDDVGYDAYDDAIGIDTIRNLGYCYNFDATDPGYGSNPPAVGFTALKGPVVPSVGDTAKYYNPPGSKNLVVKPDHMIMRISVFNIFWNGNPQVGDPSNKRETYGAMQGLKKDGTPWINPQTGQIAKLVFPGDPVTGTGWLPLSGPQRNLLIFGPLNMQHNDTQSVIVAQLEARGSSNLNSITMLRALSDHVQEVFDNNFQSVLTADNTNEFIPDKFSLAQNYPNPFNPVTTISYYIPYNSYVKITVFDINGKEVDVLANGTNTHGYHEVDFNASEFPSGTYFYRLEAQARGVNFTNTKKMMFIK